MVRVIENGKWSNKTFRITCSMCLCEYELGISDFNGIDTPFKRIVYGRSTCPECGWHDTTDLAMAEYND